MSLCYRFQIKNEYCRLMADEEAADHIEEGGTKDNRVCLEETTVYGADLRLNEVIIRWIYHCKRHYNVLTFSPSLEQVDWFGFPLTKGLSIYLLLCNLKRNQLQQFFESNFLLANWSCVSPAPDMYFKSVSMKLSQRAQLLFVFALIFNSCVHQNFLLKPLEKSGNNTSPIYSLISPFVDTFCKKQETFIIFYQKLLS